MGRRKKADIDPYEVLVTEEGQGFRVVFSDPLTGKRKRVRASTRRAANRLQKEIEDQLFAGAYGKPKDRSPTFREIATQYIERSRRGRDGRVPLEPNTLNTYQNWLEKHLLDLIGDREIDKLDRDDLIELAGALLMRFENRTSARHCFNFTKTVLNWARARGLIETSPAFKLYISADKRTRTEVRVHSHANIQKITAKLTEMRSHPNLQVRRAWEKYSVIIMMAATTGLRISELVGLKIQDFTPDFRRFKVVRRVDQFRDGRSVEERTGNLKSQRAYRELGVAEQVRPLLLDYLNSRNRPQSEWVFPKLRGAEGPVDAVHVRARGWYEIQDLAGVPRLSLHSLRHFFASELMRQGYYLEAQNLCGHHDAAYTITRYGHLIDDGSDRRRKMSTLVARTMFDDNSTSPSKGRSKMDDTLLNHRNIFWPR
ncbi:tyrosine-type recombinase/integrase [Pseudooceanicola nitratireducens]|uniref:tyrosine-type recombinase/integrase n=1 Tax=Pseudooceanicola nitratireducens TaxID=517719 RepID=UPI00333F16EB